METIILEPENYKHMHKVVSTVVNKTSKQLTLDFYKGQLTISES